jgi:hypothetical protein
MVFIKTIRQNKRANGLTVQNIINLGPITPDTVIWQAAVIVARNGMAILNALLIRIDSPF